MSNKTKFRLVVLGVLMYEFAIGGALILFDSGELDAALELLPETFDYYSLVENHFILSVSMAVIIMGMLISSIIGVLLFKNWGRWLYLGCALLIFPVSIISGPTIYYGWESALWDFANMLNGAIVLSMFLQPIANEFNKSSKKDALKRASF